MTSGDLDHTERLCLPKGEHITWAPTQHLLILAEYLFPKCLCKAVVHLLQLLTKCFVRVVQGKHASIWNIDNLNNAPPQRTNITLSSLGSPSLTSVFPDVLPIICGDTSRISNLQRLSSSSEMLLAVSTPGISSSRSSCTCTWAAGRRRCRVSTELVRG